MLCINLHLTETMLSCLFIPLTVYKQGNPHAVNFNTSHLRETWKLLVMASNQNSSWHNKRIQSVTPIIKTNKHTYIIFRQQHGPQKHRLWPLICNQMKFLDEPTYIIFVYPFWIFINGQSSTAAHITTCAQQRLGGLGVW